jgi:hypothetical protein
LQAPTGFPADAAFSEISARERPSAEPGCPAEENLAN